MKVKRSNESIEASSRLSALVRSWGRVQPNSPGTISLYQTKCGLGFLTAAPAALDPDASVVLGRGVVSGEAGVAVGRGRMWVMWTFREGNLGRARRRRRDGVGDAKGRDRGRSDMVVICCAVLDFADPTASLRYLSDEARIVSCSG